MRVEGLRGTDAAAAEQLASFADFLLQVGERRVPTHPDSDYIALPERVVVDAHQPAALIEKVFGDLGARPGTVPRGWHGFGGPWHPHAAQR